MGEWRRFLQVVSALLAVIVLGVIGYMIIEGWAFLDALYMTIITISTVGYGEVRGLSTAGRVFSIVLIVGGVGVMLYFLSTLVQYLVEGYLKNVFGRRRMKDRIAKLKGHFIVCGYGRVGLAAAHTFREEGVAVVVVDSDPEAVAKAAADGYPYIQGDAASDEVLTEAGVHKARGLVAAAGDDASNVYIILSARGLEDNLFIIVRVCCEDSKPKMERAGANKVINPYYSGGERMARLALHPLVIDFVETALHGPGHELVLEDIEIRPSSLLVGKTIGEAQVYSGGASIIATKKRDGEIFPKPPEDTAIDVGDKLVILGTREQLVLLEATT